MITRDMTVSPETIIRFRKLFGYTQEKMAEELGVGLRTYIRWENGTKYAPKFLIATLRYMHSNGGRVGD